MTARLLIRAAELLEREAAIMRDSYQTGDGSWPTDDMPIKAEHDELLDVAKRLRAQSEADDWFANHLSQAFNSGDGAYRP